MNVLARFFLNSDTRHVLYDRVYSYTMNIEISDACHLPCLFLSWRLACPWQDRFLGNLCWDKACHNLVCDQGRNILVLMNRHPRYCTWFSHIFFSCVKTPLEPCLHVCLIRSFFDSDILDVLFVFITNKWILDSVLPSSL